MSSGCIEPASTAVSAWTTRTTRLKQKTMFPPMNPSALKNQLSAAVKNSDAERLVGDKNLPRRRVQRRAIFSAPVFLEMLEDAKKGVINLLILVKNLSRPRA